MEHDKKSLMVTLWISRIGIAVLCFCVFLIPHIVRWYDLYSNKDSVFVPMTVILYVVLIPAFIILFLLNKLLSRIKNGEVFEHGNVAVFRVMSYCCLIIAVIFVVLMYWRFLAILPAAAFLFIGLLLRVLKNVFEQAVIIREENDLTV